MVRTRLVSLAVPFAAVSLLAGCPAAAPQAPLLPVVEGASKAFPVGARPVGAAAAGGVIYLANAGDGTVALFDTQTEAVTKTLTLDGTKAVGVRAFPDRRHVLVTDGARNEAIVIDPIGNPRPSASATPLPMPGSSPAPSPSLDPHQVVQRVPLGGRPGRLAFAEDGMNVLVGLDDGQRVAHYIFGLNRWNAPDRRDLAYAVAEAEMDARGEYALVPDGASGRLMRLELASGKADALLAVKRAGAVALCPLEGRPPVAIVGDLEGDALHVVGMDGQDVVVPDAGRGPADVAVDPDSKRAFVAMTGSSEVAVVDYDARKLVARIALPGKPTLITMAPPLPHEVWVATEAGQLAVLEGQNARLKSAVAIGKGPHAMTFWGTKGYVANAADGTLSVVDRIKLR